MDGAADNSSPPVAIDAHGLRKRYRLGELSSLQHTIRHLTGRANRETRPELEALAGVDFKVHRGESLGIVGTNGSGKSTLLQILTGATVPTSGHADVHGRVLGLLAVGAGFHGELTGRENVTLLGASLGIPRMAIRDRMDAVAEFGELERHMDTPVKRYSTGMLSRLSFSIAMQFPADIYIFDEVLAVVDGEFQASCLDAIKGLHREGRTVIFVSHSLHQVVDVCERVMWLDGGRLARVGPTADVLDAYTAAHSGR